MGQSPDKLSLTSTLALLLSRFTFKLAEKAYFGSPGRNLAVASLDL